MRVEVLINTNWTCLSTNGDDDLLWLISGLTEDVSWQRSKPVGLLQEKQFSVNLPRTEIKTAWKFYY